MSQYASLCVTVCQPHTSTEEDPVQDWPPHIFILNEQWRNYLNSYRFNSTRPDIVHPKFLGNHHTPISLLEKEFGLIDGSSQP